MDTFPLDFTQHIANILDARGYIVNEEVSEKKIRMYFDTFSRMLDEQNLITGSVIKRTVYYVNLTILYKNILSELLDYESDDIDAIAHGFVEFEMESFPDILNGK